MSICCMWQTLCIKIVFFRLFELPLEAQGTHVILISPKSTEEFGSRRRASALSTLRPWTRAGRSGITGPCSWTGWDPALGHTDPAEAQPSQPATFAGVCLPFPSYPGTSDFYKMRITSRQSHRKDGAGLLGDHFFPCCDPAHLTPGI